MNQLVENINQLLPQTQCKECGYDGCLPYAQALSNHQAAVNLCSAGGEQVMLDIAQLLNKPTLAPIKVQAKAVAWIDEQACIGCTACIRACPVDAIMGASKLMHTVIADECTGCGLCVSPCPVDCIHLQHVSDAYLPRIHAQGSTRYEAASHAKQRYEWHTQRLARDLAERKALLAKREAASRQALSHTQTAVPSAPSHSAFNPAALIAQAMAKANAQQAQRVVPSNQQNFKEQQIKEAQEKALFRRYQRDAQYGNEQEKQTAIAWLRQYKAEQEAKAANE